MDNTEWEQRFKALGDIEELLKVAAPQYRSPKEYYEKLIKNEPNVKIAEKRLRLLEDLRVKNKEDKLRLELDRVVRERNSILKDTDWTQLADAPLDSNQKKLYRKYRQYLRDLPEGIQKSTLDMECMLFDKWRGWIEEVRYIPGYEKYMP